MNGMNGTPPARAWTTLRGLALPAALLSLVVAPLGSGGALGAQEEEDCRCEPFRIMTPGNVFSMMGDRPMLGVSLAMGLDRDLDDLGVRITDVMEDGPAEAAGLREGDVITSLAGHDLAEPLSESRERRFDDDRSYPGQRLTALARDLEEGEPVEVVVLRDGETMNFSVTPEILDVFRLSGNVIPNVTRRLDDFRDELQDMDWSFDWRQSDGDRTFNAPRVQIAGGDGPFFSIFGRAGGLRLVEVNEGLGSYFGTDRGVLVTDVDDDSSLGLQSGDVILEVDGREVDDPGHFYRIIGSYRDGEAVELTVMRDGNRIQVAGQAR